MGNPNITAQTITDKSQDANLKYFQNQMESVFDEVVAPNQKAKDKPLPMTDVQATQLIKKIETAANVGKVDGDLTPEEGLRGFNTMIGTATGPQKTRLEAAYGQYKTYILSQDKNNKALIQQVEGGAPQPAPKDDKQPVTPAPTPNTGVPFASDKIGKTGTDKTNDVSCNEFRTAVANDLGLKTKIVKVDVGVQTDPVTGNVINETDLRTGKYKPLIVPEVSVDPKGATPEKVAATLKKNFSADFLNTQMDSNQDGVFDKDDVQTSMQGYTSGNSKPTVRDGSVLTKLDTPLTAYMEDVYQHAETYETAADQATKAKASWAEQKIEYTSKGKLYDSHPAGVVFERSHYHPENISAAQWDKTLASNVSTNPERDVKIKKVITQDTKAVVDAYYKHAHKGYDAERGVTYTLDGEELKAFTTDLNAQGIAVKKEQAKVLRDIIQQAPVKSKELIAGYLLEQKNI